MTTKWLWRYGIMNWGVSYVYTTSCIKWRHIWERHACYLKDKWVHPETKRIGKEHGRHKDILKAWAWKELSECAELEGCPRNHSTDGAWQEWRVKACPRFTPSDVIRQCENGGVGDLGTLHTVRGWPFPLPATLSNSLNNHRWILSRLS